MREWLTRLARALRRRLPWHRAIGPGDLRGRGPFGSHGRRRRLDRRTRHHQFSTNWRGRHWHFALYWRYRLQQANQGDDSGPPPEFGDPFSHVRVPAWRGPGGRSGAIALPEPDDDAAVLAVACSAHDRVRD
jgi:hypothetical protein